MPETSQLEFFARCASGFEQVLGEELRRLGCRRVRPLVGGVAFFGTLEDGLRCCLWSRVATRIQLVLARVDAHDADMLYEGVLAFPWEEHVAPGATIAMQAHGQNASLRNTQFTALKVKDAVCDRLARVRGARPSVNAKDPDFSLDIALHKDRATLCLNLSGPSLHRRGYRAPSVQTEAPLKETLAAGILLAAGWSEPADAGAAFVDPMCGSGTLAIEAALIATRTAPGLLRMRWGFEGWMQHNPRLWEQLVSEARDARGGASRDVRILAGDKDEAAIRIARANAEHAGVADIVKLYVDDAQNLARYLRRIRNAQRGLLATNPPYGRRLLSQGELPETYVALSTAVAALPESWQVAVITPDPAIDTALGLRPREVVSCYNGPIEAGLHLYDLAEGRSVLKLVSLAGINRSVPVAERTSEQFAARLRKVAKQRIKQARKSGETSYRIYDADLPDYAFSIDLSQSADSALDQQVVYVEERPAGKGVDVQRATRRFYDALSIIPAILDVDPSDVSASRARTKS